MQFEFPAFVVLAHPLPEQREREFCTFFACFNVARAGTLLRSLERAVSCDHFQCLSNGEEEGDTVSVASSLSRLPLNLVSCVAAKERPPPPQMLNPNNPQSPHSTRLGIAQSARRRALAPLLYPGPGSIPGGASNLFVECSQQQPGIHFSVASSSLRVFC